MYRDACTQPCGLLNRGRQLGFRVLIDTVVHAVAQIIAAGFVDFDEVRALFNLLADDGNKLLSIIGIGGIGENVLLRVVIDGVFVTTENAYCIAADSHARPGYEAFVDSVPNCSVGRTRAFRAHVALGGEAGHQILSRVQKRNYRALRDRFLNGLKVLRSWVKKQMHVHIDEARHEGAIAKVDGFGSGLMSDARTDFDNAFAPNQDLARCDHLSRFDIQHACRVEYYGTIGSLCESNAAAHHRKGCKA